ncbi:MAG: hypothetical protein R3E79_13355 [Caldilineaceae bacterium]
MMVKPTRTLLMIEDSPEDCATYQRYLAQDPEYAYTVGVAHSGARGLALLRTTTPDCILLDYHLPDQMALRCSRLWA